MPGGRVSGFGKPDTVVNSFTSTDYFLIKNKSADKIIAEHYTKFVPLSTTVEYAKSEVIHRQTADN